MSGKINVAECIAHLRNDAECIASDDTGPIASNMRRAARALELLAGRLSNDAHVYKKIEYQNMIAAELDLGGIGEQK